MTHETDDELRRLRDERDSLEGELLRSANDDRPADRVYPAALSAVLAAHRRHRARRQQFWAFAAFAPVAAAATWMIHHALRAPEPKVVAEQATSSRPVPVLSPSATATTPPFLPCSPPSTGSGQEPMIDDFEDGDTRMTVADKRAGFWIAFNDGTAQQSPRVGSVFPANRIPGGRGTSRFGLHTTGGRFTKWGSVLAAELTPRRCYDASAYAGLSFWARGKAKLRVAAKMTQVVSEEFGGSCSKDCFDSHGAPLALTRDWVKYVVRWEELQQQGFGAPMTFDARSLYSIEFQIPKDQPSFDVWLDDVAFLER